MTQIKWDNITAPYFGASNQLAAQSADQIERGLSGLAAEARNQTALANQNYQTGVKNNTDQAMAMLNQATREAMSQGRTLTPEEEQTIIGRFGAQIDKGRLTEAMPTIMDNANSKRILQNEFQNAAYMKSAEESVTNNAVYGKDGSFDLDGSRKAISADESLSPQARIIAQNMVSQQHQQSLKDQGTWGNPVGMKKPDGSTGYVQINSVDGSMRDVEGHGTAIPNVDPVTGATTTPLTEFNSKQDEDYYTDANTAYKEAGNTGVQLSNLYNQMENTEFSSGVFGWGVKQFDSFFGTQDEATAVRTQFNNLRNSTVLKHLPPGVASDKDIELAMKGVPDEFTNKASAQSYIHGLAKLNYIVQLQSRHEIAYMDAHGSRRGMLADWEKNKGQLISDGLSDFNSKYGATDSGSTDSIDHSNLWN